MFSGVSLNVFYDTRDNQINPYKGIYANINYRINPTFLGSDQNSTSLWLEFRTYLGLSRKPQAYHWFWAFGTSTFPAICLTLPCHSLVKTSVPVQAGGIPMAGPGRKHDLW